MIQDGYKAGEESGTQRRVAKEQRFWEVDAARGVAIIMMVVYHLTYDLDAFGGYGIEATTGFWARFADVTASLFLFFGIGIVAFGILHLIGVSIVLAYPLLNLRLSNFLLGALAFAAGMYVMAQDPMGSPWLLPFGVVPE